MAIEFSYRKQGQGSIVRPVAGLSLIGLAAFGCGSLAAGVNMGWWEQVLYTIPFFEFQISLGEIISFLLFVGLSFGIYLFVVNHPVASDFLIETEAELRKVSWPEGDEFVNASIVVIISILIIAALLALFDFLFVSLMEQIQVLPG